MMPGVWTISSTAFIFSQAHHFAERISILRQKVDQYNLFIRCIESIAERLSDLNMHLISFKVTLQSLGDHKISNRIIQRV